MSHLFIIGLVVWFFVSVGLGVLVGRFIGETDRRYQEAMDSCS